MAQPRTSIELLAQADVQGDTVLLGHVARLRSSDLAVMRRLVHLPIGRAPQPGQVAVLKQESLAPWIRRQTGIAAADLDVRGAQESLVTGSAGMVKGEEIGRAAAESLRAWLRARSVQAAVHVRVPPRDVQVYGGAMRLEPRPIEQSVPRKRMVVWVDVWAADVLVRTVPASLELDGLEASDVALQGPLEERAERSSTSAATGEPFAVLRGEWATLRSVSGPVVLEAAVEVLQDGRSGQKVRVRQRGATAVVMARVLGPGQVEVAP
jgi:flagella basal body P-ring formation protein FlgA